MGLQGLVAADVVNRTESGRTDAIKLLSVAAQLALLLLIVRQFAVLDTGFRYLFALTLPGFLIHAVLPMRYRLGFFVALSGAAAFLVLGGEAVVLFGIGLALVAILYLPVSFTIRVALVVAVGTALAVARAGWIPLPWLQNVWPVLASMFMFRLIVYLYDTRLERERPPVLRTLGYFFMLPNVCFPLFPVVDYKKFNRSYYSGDAYDIYQRGVSWMVRGVVHLLLYRIVYQYLAIDPTTAAGLGDALRFSFSAFLLYFQVSGTFHLIVGMLLLFGFNLPETHHRYFLASSFNDFWRRINIYWKDFMMKLFYYPVYFRVRRLGDTAAIVVSTLVVFVGTWFLHAYQWFWLRGTPLIEWHDGLFWLVLAVLVVVNSLYENRFGRERQAARVGQNWCDRLSLWLSIAATFLTIGLIWGMWSSDSLAQWLILWETTDGAWWLFTVLIPLLYALSLVLKRVASRFPRPQARARSVTVPAAGAGFWPVAAATAAFLVCVYSVGTAALQSRLPESAGTAIASLQTVRLNARDEAQLIRGYYEGLVRVNRHEEGLWSLLDGRPADWGQPSIPGVEGPTGDLRVERVMPDLEYRYKGATVTTNRWGMRDRDYPLERSPGVPRVAILGQSYVYGSGVENDRVFEALLESKLNATGVWSKGIEVLNFAAPGRGLIRQAAILEKDITQFSPDVLIVFGHRNDAVRAVYDVDLLIEHGIDPKIPAIRSIIEASGLSPAEAPHLRRQRLSRYRYDLFTWAHRRIVELCRDNGIRPVYVYLPFTADTASDAGPPEQDTAIVAAAGYETTIDLSGVFAGQSPESLRLAAWDSHPNERGHRLIAERLFAALAADEFRLLALPEQQASDSVRVSLQGR